MTTCRWPAARETRSDVPRGHTPSPRIKDKQDVPPRGMRQRTEHSLDVLQILQPFRHARHLAFWLNVGKAQIVTLVRASRPSSLERSARGKGSDRRPVRWNRRHGVQMRIFLYRIRTETDAAYPPTFDLWIASRSGIAQRGERRHQESSPFKATQLPNGVVCLEAPNIAPPPQPPARHANEHRCRPAPSLARFLAANPAARPDGRRNDIDPADHRGPTERQIGCLTAIGH